jgi:hypothetical protein
MAENEGVGETGEAIVMCIVPDICLTNGVPVPYQIIARFDSVIRQQATVVFKGNKAMTMDSRVTKVIGDEAGTGGGIISGVNLGYCRPIKTSSTVFAGGYNVIYHSAFYWMNCAGPEGPGNTVGRVVYVENINCVHVGPLGQFVGATNPDGKAEGKKEETWLDKLKWLNQQVQEYQQALWQGRWDAVKSWGSDIAGLARFAADTSPIGMADSAVQGLFGVKLPEWMPSMDRAAGQVASGVKSVAGFAIDSSPLGGVGDDLRDLGVSLPAWAPSQARARQEVAGAVHAVVDPYKKLIEEGHYGAALGKAQAGVEKVGVEIALTEGAGELVEGARSAQTVDEALTTAMQATKDGVEVTGKSWKSATEFRGTKVYQRSDLIDPLLGDGNGLTNLERMQKGLAPLGPDGKPINLHHLIQTQDSSIAELTDTFHKVNSKAIHINPNTVPSGIDRAAFNAWRRAYWKNRALDFAR